MTTTNNEIKPVKLKGWGFVRKKKSQKPTEFNLSEGIINNGIVQNVISVGDVKEFIRLLKEATRFDDMPSHETIWEEIDKLAGDRMKTQKPTRARIIGISKNTFFYMKREWIKEGFKQGQLSVFNIIENDIGWRYMNDEGKWNKEEGLEELKAQIQGGKE